MAQVSVSFVDPGRAPGSSISPVAYRSEIDGLRAIAVLAVLIFHLNRRWLTGGFVDLEAILTKTSLSPRPEDACLDVGCGFGNLQIAMQAKFRAGAVVLGITRTRCRSIGPNRTAI